VTLATLRNVAIILALAAGVVFVPGGATTGDVLWQTLAILFLGGLGILAHRIYHERRYTLFGLGDRNRAILYGSLGLAMLAVAGTSKLWHTGGGTLAWFALVAAAAFGLFHVVRSARAY
jgi:hypothetical protein